METTDARRLESIDLVRGLVMVIMLLDHTRDFTHASGGLWDPLDAARTTPAVYLTRWVTHICAPTFVLLAGTSAGLQLRRGMTAAALSRFLLSRGLFLMLLELVVITPLVWAGVVPGYSPVLQVIFAIGASMVVLAALIHLPAPVVGALGLAIVAGHNLLDGFNVPEWHGPESPLPTVGQKLWSLVHQYNKFPLGAADGSIVTVQYPLLPWIGVMSVGFSMARVFELAPDRRRRLLYTGAAIAVTLFALLRGTNLYGDLRPWTWGSTTTATLMHFFNVEKYPPSLLFLLATLPFALASLAWLDGRALTSRFAQALVTYGRVPLFFYILQWIWAKFVGGATVYLIYGVKFGDDGQIVEYGGPIWLTHLLWLAGAFALFPLCRRYAALKARRRDLAILRYL